MPGSTRKDAAPPFPGPCRQNTQCNCCEDIAARPIKGYWLCSNTGSTTEALNFEKQHTEMLKNHVKKYKRANSFSLKSLFYKKIKQTEKKLRFLGMLYIDPIK